MEDESAGGGRAVVMRPGGGCAVVMRPGGGGRGRHLRRAQNGLHEAGGVPLDLDGRRHQRSAHGWEVAVVHLVPQRRRHDVARLKQ